MSDYRSRVYERYVSHREVSVAPPTIDGFQPRAPSLQKVIKEHFPKDLSAPILDIGCGHGAFIHFIRAAGYLNVGGIDGSPEQVAESRRLGIVGVREGDLLTELGGQAASSLAVVIAYDVIEHYTKNELLDLMDEVYRVLKPGGKFIVHAPNGESPFVGRIRYGDITHEQAFTRDSILQLLMVCRFSRVTCQEDTPIPHGMKSLGRWVVWKLIRAVLRFYLAAETGSGSKNCIFSQNLLAVAIK